MRHQIYPGCENGAATLANWLLPRFIDLIGGFELTLPSEIENRDAIIYVLERTIEQQRIEVSSREVPAQHCKAGEDYQRAESVSARYERMAEGTQITGADIKLGLTSCLTYNRSLVQSQPVVPLTELQIRSAVYGCSDGKCLCGKCAAARIDQ